MDRGRDRRYEDRPPMGGETYRPAERARSPPRGNAYRGNRSPPRTRRTPPYIDTYAPAAGRPRSRSPRRRSRSPAYRGRNEGAYRGRPRSPVRAYSPRRDVIARSPPPRTRRYSRSPIPVKRREPSPSDNRRPRSPPHYVKQERYVSPARDRYERRAYSPPRERAQRYPQEASYRPRERSRSPVRRVEQPSRVASPISSHRSSPQVHPDRLAAVTGSGPHSPAYRNTRAPPPARSPGYRERSPPRRGYSPVPISPPREREPAPYRQRSPPPRRISPPPYAKDVPYKADYRNGGPQSSYVSPPMSAPPNGHLQNGNRGPPSGPGSSYRESPSGPPSAPLSMSAHSRAPPPFRGRGGGPPSYNREAREPSFQGGPPPRRGGHGPPPSPYNRGPPPPRGNFDNGPPAGPRTGHNDHRSSLPYNPPPFRPNNSSSTTYPRTQRFNNPAPASTPKIENHPSLAGLPTIVPGGKAAPSGLDPAVEKKLQQLEDDKKKLEEMIAEKQRVKRQGLREWDTKERESRRDGLRSELAEQGLEKMGMGEGSSGAAF